MLLKNGANPRFTETNGKQPIHVAAAHSGVIVKKLVENGCDINTRDPIHRDTPLHIACAMCNTETVEALIKCGAKFNMLNKHGETPLHKLLKFATNSHDFHTQSRLKLAKFLVRLGFTIPQEKIKNTKTSRGRNKVLEVYNNLKKSSKCVFTLQHLCRLEIRDSLHSTAMNTDIECMELPRNMICFLKFVDGFDYKTFAKD